MVLKVKVLQTEANSKRELMTTDPSGKMITFTPEINRFTANILGFKCQFIRPLLVVNFLICHSLIIYSVMLYQASACFKPILSLAYLC